MIKIIFKTQPELADTLSDLLTEAGAFAVTMQDASDTPVFQLAPEETPLWDSVHVEAFFPANTDFAALASQMQQQLELKQPLEYSLEKIEERDWVRETQRQFQSQCFGDNLWVCPAWEDTNELLGTIVRIDPGLAFGTGTHPTTSLCLEWLANNPPHNKTVIDYGCGSGILALAALALGAEKVYAVDHDPQAIEATNNNAMLNEFVTPKNLFVSQPDIIAGMQVDIMLANILANPLIELAPHLCALTKSQGHIILSGVLSIESDRVIEAYKPFTNLTHIATKDEWCRIDLRLKA